MAPVSGSCGAFRPLRQLLVYMFLLPPSHQLDPHLTDPLPPHTRMKTARLNAENAHPSPANSQQPPLVPSRSTACFFFPEETLLPNPRFPAETLLLRQFVRPKLPLDTRVDSALPNPDVSATRAAVSAISQRRRPNLPMFQRQRRRTSCIGERMRGCPKRKWRFRNFFKLRPQTGW